MPGGEEFGINIGPNQVGVGIAPEKKARKKVGVKPHQYQIRGELPFRKNSRNREKIKLPKGERLLREDRRTSLESHVKQIGLKLRPPVPMREEPVVAVDANGTPEERTRAIETLIEEYEKQIATSEVSSETKRLKAERDGKIYGLYVVETEADLPKEEGINNVEIEKDMRASVAEFLEEQAKRPLEEYDLKARLKEINDLAKEKEREMADFLKAHVGEVPIVEYPDNLVDVVKLEIEATRQSQEVKFRNALITAAKNEERRKEIVDDFMTGKLSDATLLEFLNFSGTNYNEIGFVDAPQAALKMRNLFMAEALEIMAKEKGHRYLYGVGPATVNYVGKPGEEGSYGVNYVNNPIFTFSLAASCADVGREVSLQGVQRVDVEKLADEMLDGGTVIGRAQVNHSQTGAFALSFAYINKLPQPNRSKIITIRQLKEIDRIKMAQYWKDNAILQEAA